ncbi:MAG: hypothetical protein VX294_02290 [Candidatus Latescibacterota bacterium]|nr:hypothetical protein [Candidatus Latescibacterota bacterium]
MRNITIPALVFSILSILFLTETTSAVPNKQIKELCKSFVGNEYWLKIAVVRIQDIAGGTDATNLYPGGNISYRATLGMFRQVQSSDSEDFAEQARASIQQHDLKTKSVRHWARGTKVKVHKVRAKRKEIEVDITEEGGSKSRIRFKFDKTPKAYTFNEVESLFTKILAVSEEDLMGAEETVEINMGMTIEEIVKVYGKPKSRINLGKKTVIKYDDMKLIFESNKLVDVE